MPPAVADDASSIDEDIPPKQAKKANAKAEPVDDDEDEGDEFVVEAIKSHRFEKSGKLKFEVKWQGYADKDNTWEPEENLEHCETELQAYYKKVGGKPLYSTAKKGSTPASSAKEITSKKRRLTEVPDTDSGTPSTRGGKGDKPKKSKMESGLESFPSADKWVPPSGSWEQDVVNIDTMEQDNDGQIWAYVMWASGHRSKHKSAVVNEKCPKKMLQFYEAHLQFKPLTETGNGTSGGALDTNMEDFATSIEEDEEGIKPVASTLAA